MRIVFTPKNSVFFALTAVFTALSITSCEPDVETIPNTVNDDIGAAQPYTLEIPEGFPEPFLPTSNPMTVQGVELGRKLFYDPILSGDFTQSCASCHNQADAFTDNGLQFSVGIDGLTGDRNAMAIINLAWGTDFFWDGRAPTLEIQAAEPVPNPIEMHLDWETAVNRLQGHGDYPDLFKGAFGTSQITEDLTTKALAQFMRSIVSGNSKYDRYARFDGSQQLTPSELNGLIIYTTETGDCFHCHPLDNMQFTDHDFHNNGLDDDATIVSTGLGGVTGEPTEFGLFKSPTLRNIEMTAPYMHDGRFATLEEVIDHYSEGLVQSTTVDPLMKKIGDGGLQLNAQQKADLLAFLLTLTDEEFLTNPDYAQP